MKVAHKRSSLISLLFVMYLACSATGQTVQVALDDVKQIKVLVSSREDVRKILANYETTFDDDHYQRFSNNAVDVKVTYSSGTCSEEESDEYDYEDQWKVGKWVVTRVEMTIDVPIRPENIGIGLKGFTRNPRYTDSPDSLVIFDKSRGLAIKTDDGIVENIIFFPARTKANQLCDSKSAVRDFYSREKWFPNSRPYDYACVLINQPANVTELLLSSTEVEATTSKLIYVTTIATDPENDVLTYTYTISAGKITGVGAKVVWDLSGVSPGTYSISVGVNDGVGILGTTQTKTVVVK